jgi:hypothetical protein
LIMPQGTIRLDVARPAQTVSARGRHGGLSRAKNTAAWRGRCLPSADPRCGRSSPPQILPK